MELRNIIMNQTILNKIITARKILILDYSFWGSLALRLTLKEDETCKTGWTDGITLGYNPHWIETLSHNGTVAWCAHEVCHPMCQHHTRRAGRNYRLWQKAADYVVNSILVKEKFDLPGQPLYDPRFDGMSTDEVYSILEKEMEEEKRKSKGGESEGGKGKNDGQEKNDPDDTSNSNANSTDNKSDTDEDEDQGDSSDDGNNDEEDNNDDNLDDEGNPDEPNNNPDEGDPDENDPDPGNCGEVRDYPGKNNQDSNNQGNNSQASPSDMKQQEQDWKIAAVQAATQAKQHGNMPAGLDAEIQNIVEPKVDPRDLLQKFVAMSAKNDFTWSMPNKKYIPQGLYLPSMKSEELGTVILVLDTSISIGQKELDNFSAIISAILETYIIDAIVLYCDTKVYEPEYFKREDLPLKLKMKGRGGTSFKKPFTWVIEHDILPTCLIYLTDLECNEYPDFEPEYPVIWICTNPEDSLYWDKPPFGEVIFINLEKG